MTTPAINQQLDKRNTALALLGALHFTTGTFRLTTWSTLQLLGQTWRGLPAGLVKVAPIQESERVEYPALDITLPQATPEMLQAAVDDESTYRGRPCEIHLVVMDDVFRVVDEPQKVWAGVMDQVTLLTGDGRSDMGSLNLRCEQPGKDSRNPQAVRLTDAQQQHKYPGDTGLSRMPALAATKNQIWLSKRFQEV
ncbi:hypothetical protein WAE61_18360 [Comamonadaceae bacterium PP-2]